MDARETAAKQAEIDSISWYHRFEFGGGLRSKSSSSPEEQSAHARIWGFIERNLDRIDFRGKTVLDIGCWDGYWSFSAEKRGAGAVLATDDLSQNWSVGRGVHLAKELLQSGIEIDLTRSIYGIAKLDRKFDIILCLGVFYHLHDPYYAFSQLRHCCHENTLVLLEGNVADLLPTNTARMELRDHGNEFFPTVGYLDELLTANYLRSDSTDMLPPPPPTAEALARAAADEAALQSAAEATAAAIAAIMSERVGFRWRWKMMLQALRGSRSGVSELHGMIIPPPRLPPPAPPPPSLLTASRIFLNCYPFQGKNEIHAYPPPFGLGIYDDRFK